MRTLTLLVSALCVLASTASAQEFAYVKPAPVAKKVKLDASAQAGLILTTGNSDTTTFSLGSRASRFAGRNKIAVEVGGAFARSSITIAQDVSGNGTLEADEIETITQTTTRAWNIKGRYDRFLSTHNALYGAAIAGGDEPAGKEFVGGGQVGYSRQLFKNDCNEFVSELGYDYSYEDLVSGDGVSIHSGRVFVGYKGSLGTATGLEGSLELLANVNELPGSSKRIAALEDRRTTATLALTTKVFENISFRFGFIAKHDNAPAPQKPFATPYAADYKPLAEELDTKTEASLIVNFL